MRYYNEVPGALGIVGQAVHLAPDLMCARRLCRAFARLRLSAIGRQQLGPARSPALRPPEHLMVRARRSLRRSGSESRAGIQMQAWELAGRQAGGSLGEAGGQAGKRVQATGWASGVELRWKE